MTWLDGGETPDERLRPNTSYRLARREYAEADRAVANGYQQALLPVSPCFGGRVVSIEQMGRGQRKDAVVPSICRATPQLPLPALSLLGRDWSAHGERIVGAIAPLSAVPRRNLPPLKRRRLASASTCGRNSATDGTGSEMAHTAVHRSFIGGNAEWPQPGFLQLMGAYRLRARPEASTSARDGLHRRAHSRGVPCSCARRPPRSGSR